MNMLYTVNLLIRFCKSCLAKYEDILSPACPVCRQLFDIPTSKKARDIIKTMKTSSVLCLPCGQMIPLLKLRCHHSTCLNLTDKTKASAQSLEKEEDDSL